jgi:hypothetical protein
MTLDSNSESSELDTWSDLCEDLSAQTENITFTEE